MNALEFFLSRVEGDDWSYSKLVTAVFNITTEEEARLFLKGYIEWQQAFNPNQKREECERIARDNIGYTFGEGLGDETRELWNRATGIVHPYFGMVHPNPLEAFHIGCSLGEKVKFEKEVVEDLQEEMTEEFWKRRRRSV